MKLGWWLIGLRQARKRVNKLGCNWNGPDRDAEVGERHIDRHLVRFVDRSFGLGMEHPYARDAYWCCELQLDYWA